MDGFGSKVGFCTPFANAIPDASNRIVLTIAFLTELTMPQAPVVLTFLLAMAAGSAIAHNECEPFVAEKQKCPSLNEYDPSDPPSASRASPTSDSPASHLECVRHAKHSVDERAAMRHVPTVDLTVPASEVDAVSQPPLAKDTSPESSTVNVEASLASAWSSLVSRFTGFMTAKVGTHQLQAKRGETYSGMSPDAIDQPASQPPVVGAFKERTLGDVLSIVKAKLGLAAPTGPAESSDRLLALTE